MPTLDMAQLGKMFKKIPAKVRRDVDKGIQLAAHRGRTHLIKKTPTDQGQARNSWVATKKTIRNDAPHIGILERGARPHKVSREGIESLTQWALRTLTVRRKKAGKKSPKKGKKAGKKSPKKGKKAGKKTPRVRKGLKEPQARAVAFAIAKKIEQEGQQGKFFVQKSLPRIKGFLKKEIEEQLRKRA